MEKPTTTAYFRSSILTTSPLQQLLFAGRQGPRPRYVLVRNFPREGVHWIEEVELVDSVDDLESSLFVRGIRMPDFEVLDARIASSLNRIIHNSHFKRRISLEEQMAQKQDRFLRGRLLT